MQVHLFKERERRGKGVEDIFIIAEVLRTQKGERKGGQWFRQGRVRGRWTGRDREIWRGRTGRYGETGRCGEREERKSEKPRRREGE